MKCRGPMAIWGMGGQTRKAWGERSDTRPALAALMNLPIKLQRVVGSDKADAIGVE